MARTPDGPSARTEKITIRATKSWAAQLDRNRGKMTRSEYIRRLVSQQSAHTGKRE